MKSTGSHLSSSNCCWQKGMKMTTSTESNWMPQMNMNRSSMTNTDRKPMTPDLPVYWRNTRISSRRNYPRQHQSTEQLSTISHSSQTLSQSRCTSINYHPNTARLSKNTSKNY